MLPPECQSPWPSALRLVLPLKTKMRVVAPGVKLPPSGVRNMRLFQADQLAAPELGNRTGRVLDHLAEDIHIACAATITRPIRPTMMITVMG